MADSHLKNEPEPVSYTHLDVYKRQVYPDHCMLYWMKKTVAGLPIASRHSGLMQRSQIHVHLNTLILRCLHFLQI